MKILLYLIGMFLMIIGITFMMLYTNLFSFGYSFFEYFIFIISRVEVDIFFLGLLIIIFIALKR